MLGRAGLHQSTVGLQDFRQQSYLVPFAYEETNFQPVFLEGTHAYIES